MRTVRTGVVGAVVAGLIAIGAAAGAGGAGAAGGGGAGAGAHAAGGAVDGRAGAAGGGGLSPGVDAGAEARTTRGPEATAAKRRCHPSYRGRCLKPNASDYDCAGGGGNGPYYVSGPFRGVGSDPYRLDADHDGIACER